jgi:hypothetical protein
VKLIIQADEKESTWLPKNVDANGKCLSKRIEIGENAG